MAINKVLSDRKKESYKIFDQIAPTYDLLNHLLSFGIDIYWRRLFLRQLPKGVHLKVLDLATGTGDVPLLLAKQKNIQHITGIDLSEKMIEFGNKKVKKSTLGKKINLHKGDAVHIPYEKNEFDLVTISFGIRNFSSCIDSLKDIHRVLKPHGRVLIMEFSIPQNKFIKSLYFFYFRHILPFIGNLISKHGDAYTYLNQTVEDFPYGANFLFLLEQAGFKRARLKKITFGVATLYIGDKVI